MINGDLLDSLSPEQQKALRSAAQKANALNRQVMAEQDAADVAFLVEKGMISHSPSPEEMETFRTAAQPAYVAWLRDRVGEEWLDLALTCASRANEKGAR